MSLLANEYRRLSNSYVAPSILPGLEDMGCCSGKTICHENGGEKAGRMQQREENRIKKMNGSVEQWETKKGT